MIITEIVCKKILIYKTKKVNKNNKTFTLKL